MSELYNLVIDHNDLMILCDSYSAEESGIHPASKNASRLELTVDKTDESGEMLKAEEEIVSINLDAQEQQQYFEAKHMISEEFKVNLWSFQQEYKASVLNLPQIVLAQNLKSLICRDIEVSASMSIITAEVSEWEAAVSFIIKLSYTDQTGSID